MNEFFQTLNPISKKKRKSFANSPMSADVIRKECKTEQMENRAFATIIDLTQKENPEIYGEIFNYRVTEECLTFYNTNGTMRKCQKSKLQQKLSFHEIYL